MATTTFDESTGLPQQQTTPAAAPTADVPIVAPGGGVVNVKGADLQQAVDAGAHVASAEEVAQQRAANEAEKSVYQRTREHGHGVVVSGLAQAMAGSQIQEAWHQAGLEGASGGLAQAAVAEALGGMDEKWKRAYVGELDRLRTEYPGTRVVGNVAGNIARDAVLSSVGVPSVGGAVEGAASRGLGWFASRGLAARAVSRGLASAAGAGVEAGAFGGAQELSEEMLGDQPLAAEKILAAAGKSGMLGAVFGFGLGAGGELAVSGVRAAGGAAKSALAKNAENLQGMASEQRWKALSPLKKYTEEVKARVPGGTEAAGRVLGEYGVTGRSVQEALAEGAPDAILPKIAAAKRTVGERLGDIRGGSSATVRAGDLLDDFDKALAKVESSGFHQDVADSLRKTKLEFAGKIGAVDVAAAAEGKLVFLHDALVPVQKLIEQRQFLQQRVYEESGALDVASRSRVGLLRDVSRDMSKREVGAIDDAAKLAGDTDTGAQLRKLSRDYQVLSIAEDAAEKSSSRMATNRNISLSGYQVASGLIAGGHGLMAPFAAVGHQFIKERGNALLAVALDRAADIGYAFRAAQKTDALMERAARGLTGGTAGRAALPSTPLHARFAEAVRRVSQIAADPQGMMDRTRQHTIPNAPNVSAAMALGAIRSAQFLQGQLPATMSRQTLGVPERQPRASTSDMVKFMATYDAVTDPAKVLEHVGAGRVNRQEIFALKNASPALFAELQKRTLEEVAKAQASRKPLSHDQRVKLGIVLEIPTDPALVPATLARLQASLKGDDTVSSDDKGGRPGPSRPIDLKTEPQGLDRIEAAQ